MSRKDELLARLNKITEKEKPPVPAGPKSILVSNQYGEDKDGNPIYIDRMYGGINGKHRLLQGKYGEEYKGSIKKKRVRRKRASGDGFWQQFHVTADGRWFDNSGMPCSEPKDVEFEKEEEPEEKVKPKADELDMLKGLK
tara:strand:+ start:8498 stop:8917 length:420 start_codon:yes stop_codon:yes gene_type:complete